jgi:hypothetical protein
LLVTGCLLRNSFGQPATATGNTGEPWPAAITLTFPSAFAAVRGRVTFCKDCLVDIAGNPYCATCKGEQLLDVRSGVDRTNLQYASIGRRFAAQFLDGLIICVPTIFVIMALAFSAAASGNSAPSPIFNLWFIIPSILAVIYEALMLKSRGQTLGKMAMKVKVTLMHRPLRRSGSAAPWAARSSDFSHHRLHPGVLHKREDHDSRHDGANARRHGRKTRWPPRQKEAPYRGPSVRIAKRSFLKSRAAAAA